ILDSIRRACRPGTWSLGVNLARGGGVAVESRNEEEIVARVRAPGRAVAPTVVLYPGEREWDCDCGGRVSPCEHVAAAAIFLGQPADAAADGDGPPRSVNSATGAATAAAPSRPRARWGRVVYKLARAEGGLRVTRFIVATDGAESPLASTLSALL